jgi:hypothetical protein
MLAGCNDFVFLCEAIVTLPACIEPLFHPPFVSPLSPLQSFAIVKAREKLA